MSGRDPKRGKRDGWVGAWEGGREGRSGSITRSGFATQIEEAVEGGKGGG